MIIMMIIMKIVKYKAYRVIKMRVVSIFDNLLQLLCQQCCKVRWLHLLQAILTDSLRTLFKKRKKYRL